MKRVFIIATALIAALPMAHATGLLYTFTSTGPATNLGVTSETVTAGAYGITVWGYDGSGVSGTTPGSIKLAGSPSDLSTDVYGLGVAATSDEITLNGFVVIDFSDPASPGPKGPELAGYTSATIDLDNADSGWVIYGGNSAPVLTGSSSGIGSLTEITSGNLNFDGNISIAGYSYIAIVAAETCELNLNSITLNIPATTPEPGTFVMAGMALIGLGAALRKTCKR